MPSFTDNDELHPQVKPLTAAERKWVTQLEKVLLACPSSRLQLVTIGDPTLTVTDYGVELSEGLDIHDGKAHRNGLALADINSKPSIAGVSG
jgi:hypothetical protein